MVNNFASNQSQYPQTDSSSMASRFGSANTPYESFAGHEFLMKFPSWIGSDISVLGNSVIRPGEQLPIRVLLKKEHFPDVWNGEIFRGWVKNLSYSTRSCFAQSWVFVTDDWASGINNDMLHEINLMGETVLEITVKNIGYAPIRITDGVGLFRFFHFSRHDKVRKSKLYSLIRDEGFFISWKYGETWFLIDGYGNKLDEKSHAQAENLILILNDNRYKPGGKNGIEPIIVKSKKDLAHILNPLDTDEEIDFVIGETPAVALKKGIYGKIFTMCYSHDDLFQEKVTGSRHEPSPLIDEGFSGPIRTEISGWNRFVEMEIYKKP